jgi:hypothetical protein
MNIALCKCGVDMGDHGSDLDHEFDASGTRHTCGAPVQGFHCARPGYHEEENVPCGPLTGDKLW